MNVLTIVGSPRRGGNTDTVLEVMAGLCEERGCRVGRIYLNEINMRGCQGCMSCKKTADRCVLEDGMTPVYELIQESGLVLMGTPVYLWDVSGRFKLFADRCFAFWERSYRSRMKPGKTAVLVTVLGQNKIKKGSSISEKYAGIFRRIGFARVEPVVFPGVNGRGAMTKRQDYLEAARHLTGRILQEVTGQVY
jgi:multimeric flavodoxin WrbA